MTAQPEKMFLFRLALRLGMTVSRLLDEVDSREICDWMAFFALENERAEQGPSAEKGDVAARLRASLGAYNASPAAKKPAKKRRR